PLFLIYISLMARHLRRMLGDFSERGILLNPAGFKPHPTKIQSALDEELRSNNMFFYLLMGAGVLMTFGGWIPTDGRSLWDFKLYDQVVDWTTIIIPCKWSESRNSVLAFTLLAYIWMGFCLFVYLGCLFLGFIYASFLARLSSGQIQTETTQIDCRLFLR